MTMTDQCAPLIREFQRALRAANKSARTVENYRDAARFFCQFLDDPDAYAAALAFDADEPIDVPPPGDAGDVLDHHVQAWMIHLLATWSPSTAETRYKGLVQWFTWLLAEDEITAHPMAGMRPPNVPEQPVPILPDDLLTKLLNDTKGKSLIDRRDHALLRVFCDTGDRMSEVAGLNNSGDVDLDLDQLDVLGKGGRRRHTPFGAKTGQALSRYKRMRDADPRAKNHDMFWISTRNGMPLTANGIKQALRRRGRRAGVNDVMGRNMHAHLGRHFQSHHFRKAGGSEGDLMRLNGWKSRAMPQRYGSSAADERAHESARRIAVGDRL